MVFKNVDVESDNLCISLIYEIVNIDLMILYIKFKEAVFEKK